MTNETPESILDFWFGDTLHSPDALAERIALWFQSTPAFDEEIRRRFAALPALARAGDLEQWREAPRACLALVLVLDQFPRNLYRGDAQSFAFDSRALQVATQAVDQGFDEKLGPLEAAFLYMPFEHAENLDAQNRCVDLMQGLVARAPDALRLQFRSFVSFARRHRAVIEQFGRFPHRNETLGRVSTPEESAFLASGGESFGGGAQDG